MTENSRLNSLENKVSHLDNTVAKLMGKIDAYLDEKKEHERTLRNIDDNLKALTVQMATSTGERHKEYEEQITPIWNVVRKHDSRFHECGAAIKDEMRKEARSHLGIIYLFMLVIVGLCSYVYINDKDTLIKDISNIEHSFNMHHENHHYKEKVNGRYIKQPEQK